MPPKSGFSRTKNIGYDDDDYYDDDIDSTHEFNEKEDASEFTAEDKELMRAGKIRVRDGLGEKSDFLSDSEIEDALWHYYYDSDKSVIYLKNKMGLGVQKETLQKEKKTSRFDDAAGAADLRAPATTGKQSQRMSCHEGKSALPTVFPLALPTNCIDMDDFFWDVPWQAVPLNRLANIIIDAPVRRGGLLGGSSKLAALAAKRRKEREEAQASSTTTESNDADAAINMLDKLSVRLKSSKMKEANNKQTEVERPLRNSRYPTRRRSPSRPGQEQTAVSKIEEVELPQQAVVAENLAQRAPASTFAFTLCGSEQASIAEVIPITPLTGTETTRFQAFQDPSPDDIVRAAQAKSAGTTLKKKKTHLAKENDLSDSVKGLTVAEITVKSKNLNVLEEFNKSGLKRMINFVVIGHVDHGKSTLMGRLLFDLKVIDQRSIDKLRKEAETMGKASFALAWVMDETSEERKRGITVDIAARTFETERTRFTILDAPGHRDFIPSMISGASQADFPVLVVNASANAFEAGLKGQIKEHILIARSMGMQQIVVAVNKMDAVSWSQARFLDVSKRLTAYLAEASYLPKRITFVPTAGLTGGNVVKKVNEPAAHWYTGQTLLEVLEHIDAPPRLLEKPLRLAIADIFRGDIRSPLSISGRIDAGSLQVGDKILVLPANHTAIIKMVELQEEPVDWAVAGQIPILHLANIEPAHLRQGDIVCAPGSPVKLVRAFTSKLLAFEHVMPMSVEVFRSTLKSPGDIRSLTAKLNKFTGEVTHKKPRMVKPGEVARVLVQLDRELPVEEGMRIVLRERGRTVGAGLMENVA